jgi:GR25 family glycosyltransferase involved in LPS biosynthesis
VIVERSHEWALIIEDDALFRTRRLSRLQFESIPPGTDMVFLNAFLDATPPLDRIAPGLYADTSYAGSAAAYIVSLSAAEKLLEAAVPVVHAADGLTGRVLALPPNGSHPFRQKGVSLSLKAVLAYPEAVTNGSTEHYYRSSIR